MRLLSPDHEFTIDITSFQPHFESGIEWRCVGGLWQSVDRGVSCDHYSATITIEDEYAKVELARQAILDCAKKASLPITLYCNEAEKIFGSEFWYGEAYPYQCFVSAQEEPLESIAPDGRVIESWSFTLLCLTDVSARYKYPGTQPTDIAVAKITKQQNIKATDHKLYQGYAKVSNLHKEPITTLKWIGPTSSIGSIKRYYIEQRNNAFTLASPSGLYYFNVGIQSQSVYFYDLNEYGGKNQDSSEGELDVTLLYAG